MDSAMSDTENQRRKKRAVAEKHSLVRVEARKRPRFEKGREYRGANVAVAKLRYPIR